MGPRATESPHVCVLMAAHNRREQTLRCLRALAIASKDICRLQVILVDDGSSDGTAAAVEAQFPSVHMARGDGDLYWAGGMRLAEQIAFAEGFAKDLILWLNDDVVLSPNGLGVLLALKEGSGGDGRTVAVGALRDPSSGRMSYGGLRRRKWYRPFSFELVRPDGSPKECTTFTGNCVLIGTDDYANLGGISKAYVHNLGDIDFGLRARKLGIRIVQTPDYVGHCSINPIGGIAPRASLGIGARLRSFTSPKGLPPRAHVHFLRAHAGPAWPLFLVVHYARAVFARLEA